MENTEAKAIATLAKPVDKVARGALVVVSTDYKVCDTEQFELGRNRARGAFSTPSFLDFKDFVKNHGDENTPVLVDPKNANAVAVLNFDEQGFAQGHCDYTATLQLEPTVAWKKLTELKGKKLDQRSFAIFLEDWASVFAATSSDGASFIDMNTAINAVRNMTIDASSSKESTVESLSESTSSLDRIEAKSKIGAIPAFFTIVDEAYFGLDPRDIKLRLVINAADGKPTFSLQIVKEELLLDEIIKEFKQTVIELLPENHVHIGTFAA